MYRWLRSIAWVLVPSFLGSCTTGTAPSPVPAAPPPPIVSGDAGAGSGPAGALLGPVVPSRASFESAIAAGTRTSAGVPGPDYWSQEVDYSIQAELNPETAVLEGRETITYRNHSPDALDRIILRLYQNLFAPGAERTRTVPVTGGMTVDRVEVGGRVFPSQPDRPTRGAYLIDGTLMAVYLEEPLRPGGSLQLEVEWSFEVPPAGAPRQGHIENRLFNIAQWYPQVAVYDDLEGWHIWPYLGNGEFYLEYGDFDVEITVPEGWLVGATGALQNVGDVLTQEISTRLERAMTSDQVVRVVTQEDLDAGRATVASAGGTLTWQFRAENVRDFALATSDQYVWDASRAITPDADGDGEDELVGVHAFYRPSVDSWTDAAEYIRHAVTFHAERWLPYPWPQMTGAEGPVSGMEYPMLTFVSAFSEPRTVYEVLNHEIGHMWYPMIVGSNEASYPWMDEGLTTYIEGYATADYWDDPEYWRNDQSAYLIVAGLEGETPVMRHADLHGPYGTYPQAAYWKPATLLRALEGVVGREAVWAALRAYAESWRYGHPAPEDFFNLVEATAAQDLDWFWYPFWYETAALDQAITDVRITEGGGDREAEITLANLGDALMPVSLVLELSDGATLSHSVPVQAWFGGTGRHTVGVELPPGATLKAVEIDPEALFPDVNRENNVWQP